MRLTTRVVVTLVAVQLALASGLGRAQSNAPKEEFTAVAIANNNVATGTGRVIIQISRWSSDAERERLVKTLPIGFWEAQNRPRTVDYPFTVIQMQMGSDGKGKGTLSYATKIEAAGNVISLENFASAPVMLTQIEARHHSD